MCLRFYMTRIKKFEASEVIFLLGIIPCQERWGLPGVWGRYLSVLLLTFTEIKSCILHNQTWRSICKSGHMGYGEELRISPFNPTIHLTYIFPSQHSLFLAEEKYRIGTGQDTGLQQIYYCINNICPAWRQFGTMSEFGPLNRFIYQCIPSTKNIHLQPFLL